LVEEVTLPLLGLLDLLLMVLVSDIFMPEVVVLLSRLENAAFHLADSAWLFQHRIDTSLESSLTAISKFNCNRESSSFLRGFILLVVAGSFVSELVVTFGIDKVSITSFNCVKRMDGGGVLGTDYSILKKDSWGVFRVIINT